MTAVDYERDGSIDTVERDDYHTDKDGFVTLYDMESKRRNIIIPTQRVVMIRD